MKDEGAIQGQKHGTTVPRQREIMLLGGNMTRPDDELAANRRSIVLKGRIRSKITVLEKLYGKYRLTVMRRWKTLAGPIEAARTSLGLLIEI